MNIDFGSATPTQMIAEEAVPKTFKDRRQGFTEKPTVVDQNKAFNEEIKFFEAEASEMAKVVGEAGGASNQAFKSSTKAVFQRQELSDNRLLNLGGGIEPKPEGKFLDKNHICLKPTAIENMYPVDLERK